MVCLNPKRRYTKVYIKNESTSRVRTLQTWTHDRSWFRQEKVGKKMYGVVCVSLA